MLHWRVDIVAKGILLWIVGIVGIMCVLVRDSQSHFFQIGPNRDLHIFGVEINTGGRYAVVVVYTICSTVIRTLQQEVLMPWIIQSVQNDHEKSGYITSYAYQIVLVDVTYRWFDWFMYMNILLSQIDMTIIEMVGNLVTSYYMTKYYLAHSKKKNTEAGTEAGATIEIENRETIPLLEMTHFIRSYLKHPPLGNKNCHNEENNTERDMSNMGGTSACT